MEIPLATLGTAIRDARQQADITQKDLAKSLHITPRHLAEIESGRQKPSYNLLYALVHMLAIPIEGVFYPDTVHDRKELDEVVAMLHYCDEQEISVISAALHAMMKIKRDKQDIGCTE